MSGGFKHLVTFHSCYGKMPYKARWSLNCGTFARKRSDAENILFVQNKPGPKYFSMILLENEKLKMFNFQQFTVGVLHHLGHVLVL